MYWTRVGMVQALIVERLPCPAWRRMTCLQASGGARVGANMDATSSSRAMLDVLSKDANPKMQNSK